MTARKDGPDWERIEAEYRAGIKSLREIAADHGITEGAIRKRAKKDGWSRDLKAKVQAKADALVRTALVRSEVRTSGPANPTEAQQVEIEAEVQARIQIAHRTDVTRARQLVTRLLGEIELQTDSLDLLQDLSEFLRDDAGPSAKKRLDLFEAICNLPGRVSNLKALAESLSKLVDLERRVYGIGEGTGASNYEELVRSLEE